MNPFTFPFVFWSRVLGSFASGDRDISPTKLGLTRNKKAEQMRRFPDWFDENGNFIPDPKDR